MKWTNVNERIIFKFSVRVPKEFRAPGLQGGKIGALCFHRSTPGFHLARIIISVRAANRERLRVPDSTTKISGLLSSKDPLPHFGILLCSLSCVMS